MPRQRYIAAAREMYVSDEIQVDDDAQLSIVPDDNGGYFGAWVQAWVLVPVENLPDTTEAAETEPKALERAEQQKGETR